VSWEGKIMDYLVTDREGNVVLEGDEIVLGNSTGIFETVTRGPEDGLGALVVVSGREYYAKMAWGLTVVPVDAEMVRESSRAAWSALRDELAAGTVASHERRLADIGRSSVYGTSSQYGSMDIADRTDGSYEWHKAMINGD